MLRFRYLETASAAPRTWIEVVTSYEPRPLAFLCHSSGDKERVRDLYWRLQGDGISCWFDEEDLMAGQDWAYEIDRAMRASEYVIVCLSRSSINKRGFVQKELKTALDLADELPQGQVFLIPVRLEDCEPPPFVGRLHRVDLFSPTGYKQLLRVLQYPRDNSGDSTPRGASTWRQIAEPVRKTPVPARPDYATSRPPRPAGIFISYRRTDEPAFAGRMYDRLMNRFGSSRIFIDVDSIELGLDFRDALVRAMAECAAMLVVIGKGWLTAIDQHGRRKLDNPHDFVRLEIEIALSLNLIIFPVLVDGATMPQSIELPNSIAPLAQWNAVQVSHARFGSDSDILISSLGNIARP